MILHGPTQTNGRYGHEIVCAINGDWESGLLWVQQCYSRHLTNHRCVCQSPGECTWKEMMLMLSWFFHCTLESAPGKSETSHIEHFLPLIDKSPWHKDLPLKSLQAFKLKLHSQPLIDPCPCTAFKFKFQNGFLFSQLSPSAHLKGSWHSLNHLRGICTIKTSCKIYIFKHPPQY